MRLYELLEGVTAIHMPNDCEVTAVTDDSRHVTRGSLFVAVKGTHTDGHAYIQGAFEKGAAAAVTEKPSGGNCVQVNDTHDALAVIAANYYGNPAEKLSLFGVTGTNGKTSVATVLQYLLCKLSGKPSGLLSTVKVWDGSTEKAATHTTPGVLELQTTLSRMTDNGCTTCAMEVSSHALDQKRVAGITFNTGIFTNLTQDHLDYHGTMEAYYQAKRKLFFQSRCAVINIDDAYGKRLADECTHIDVTTVSTEEANADFYAFGIQLKPDCVLFELQYKGLTYPVRWNTPGMFSVYNAVCAIAAAVKFGFNTGDVIKTGEQIPLLCGRMERVELPNAAFTVIIDYAHTPDGIEAALKTARGFTAGRLIALFGCGGDRDAGKRPLMGRIAEELADFCIVTSDNPRSEDPGAIIGEITSGMTKYTANTDRKAAIAEALHMAAGGDVIMVLGKGHEKTQEIAGKLFPFDERDVIAEAWGACRSE
jgi:UDP-N-acetylmuramyl-tripeptide synthetase